MSQRLIAAALFLIGGVAVAPVSADEPETVMITLHAKPGAEKALADAIARHFDTAQRLQLLDPSAPHLTLRGTNERTGEPYFVEILTWRDAAVPDNAPRDIQAIWKEMNGLVEARGGRPALEIVHVAPVTPAK